MKIITGISASEGIAIGSAFIYRSETPQVEQRTVANTTAELARLTEALNAVDRRLADLKEKTEQTAGREEAQIFEVHRMFLTDPSFIDEIKTLIETQQINAESAIDQVVADLAGQFEALEDDYFRQRAIDIVDVGRQLLLRLSGIEFAGLEDLSQPAIVVANDLTPSDTASLDTEVALGFCTEMGSDTAHTAILARSLGIPAVVGLGAIGIASGDLLIVDGKAGELLINPDETTIETYKTRQETYERQRSLTISQARQPAITTDGHRLEVVANIGSADQAGKALEMGSEGVGLLRTEFLFLQQHTLPSEEEQYQVYRAIADTFQQMPLIIRTLDVGGDKELPSIDIAPEQNPFLGQRAIRLCLARPELFRPQLRAILRAGFERKIKIMFPLISSVSELRQVLDKLDKAKASLAADNIPFAQTLEVGMMIEVPSAAILADDLAPLVDFFSIGTNDLAQYTLAVDRTNQQVAHLADPLHPAVIRLIHQVIKAAHAHGKWVGLCGEMAGNPLAIPLLLGLEIDEFSMAAPAIPAVKAQLRSLSLSEAKEAAQHVLSLSDIEAVRDFLSNYPC